jgi:dihydrodipicolinate synthase/N-acetylneuraminate lyase
MVKFLEAVDGRIPNFAGIKYTFESLYEYNQCRLYKNGKFDMLHGQDETILPCLAMGGAQGGIGGTTNYNGCNLAGIKYTFESLYEYNQCRLYKNGKFDMLHGQDETILPCLAMGGAQGGIGGTTNYNGCNLVGIIDAWNNGDIEKARELQNFSQEVINVICHFRGNIVGGKRIMKLIGLDLGKNRTPFQNMTDEEEARMKAELEAIDFFNRCNKF